MKAHLQYLSDNVAVLRVFAEGKTFGDPYVWCATLLDLGDGSCSLHGVMQAPTPEQVKAIRSKLNASGIFRMTFERLRDEGSETHMLK